MSGDSLVHIVDDDAAVRRSLAFVMRAAGLRSREYDSAEDFLDRYEQFVPACILLDVRMPGMSGLDLQKQLKSKGITIPSIIITGHGDIPMAVASMKAGAIDFIEKPFNNDILLERIDQCLKISTQMQSEQDHKNHIRERIALLTPRERQVMDLLVRGRLNKMIASELGISTRTVEVHRAKIMEKLDARTLSDIVRMALQV